jgi:benzil reductase ((S)-benzoin forming)
MNYYIITGVSRGIGEAIGRKLLIHGNVIFCASRTMNENLVETASSMHIPLYYHEIDLSESGSVETFIHDVFSRIDPERIERIALINNAGVLEPIMSIEHIKAEMMVRHISLNLLAPSILTAGFISKTKSFSIPKTILNISSGAAYHPYAGWSMYCTSKAGLDMLTRTTGLEQSMAEFPVRIFSLAPGIVDTSMQTLIRHTDKSNFAEKDFFVKLHEEGRLSNPESVASTIVDSLFNESIPNGAVVTIDQLKDFNRKL